MKKYAYLVCIHPVSYGKINRLQIRSSKKFKIKKEALEFVSKENMSIFNLHTLAAYCGKVEEV